MVFTDLRFLPFFLVVFSVHWALRGNRARKAWLLLASYAFYAAWDWRLVSLIWVSTIVDYTVGLRMSRPGANRRGWLLLSLLVNLGMLGFFKYFNFFVGSAADFLSFLGFQPNLPTLRIVLPIGISFYTFQTLSYSIDVYRGRLAPCRSLLDLAVFVGFFPQLVAGPIMRAADFLPQLVERRSFARVDVRGALILFLVGFVKKACISDNLAVVVDRYHATPEAYSALAAWAASLFYTVQIYCDFSGYSDIAIATGALLGYRLCLNFDFPYFATNISDFWRRWHMSLSSWLRDYLYVPLGGNQGGTLFVYRNLAITLLLCGLWHGAAWKYVAFGAAHALAVIGRLEWRTRLAEDSLPRRLVTPLVGNVLTVLFFATTLIIFRGESLQTTAAGLRAFLLFDSPGQIDFGWTFAWILAGLLAAHVCAYRRVFSGWWRRMPDWGFAACYAVLFAVAQSFTAPGFKPFIYFQF